MTQPRRFRDSALLLAASLALGCGNKTARAPNPTGYDWPDQFAYRAEYVSQAQDDSGRVLLRYSEFKIIRFVARDDRYVIIQDSVLKTTDRGAGRSLVPYAPEDTLAFFAKLGRQGELTGVVPGCDPALPACAEVLPSAMPLELRRIIPRLPVWEVPRGVSWEDTLRFDDAARPGGTRGTVVTSYEPARDTLIGGVAYWMVVWHSTRQAFRRPSPTEVIAPEPPTREDGVTFVEKRRLLPAFSAWAGVTLAGGPMRDLGARAVGYRGRAWLPGSVFDSLYARRIMP